MCSAFFVCKSTMYAIAVVDDQKVQFMMFLLVPACCKLCCLLISILCKCSEQAVPIPLSKASNVQRIFNLAAKKLGFEFAVVNPGMLFVKCPYAS